MHARELPLCVERICVLGVEWAYALALLAMSALRESV
jgi:hypothetical protein